MGIKTGIEYCDSTINPIMGCTGCGLYPDHCYAAALCKRYASRKGWPKQFNRPEFFPGRMEKAIAWPDLIGTKRPNKPWLNGLPRIIFVNNLSDGFCRDVDPFGWLWPHLEEIEASPHIYLLLTKWPRKMQEFFVSVGYVPDNIWLGVSVENPGYLWRIEELMKCLAAVRFVSLEPLLAGIDLSTWLPHSHRCQSCGYVGFDFDYSMEDPICPSCGEGYAVAFANSCDDPILDWVIVGGESGPGARPMHPDGARSVRDQCQAAGVPFFFKQYGEYVLADGWNQWGTSLNGEFVDPAKVCAVRTMPEGDIYDVVHMVRISKKHAGRLLDGVLHEEYPQVA